MDPDGKSVPGSRPGTMIMLRSKGMTTEPQSLCRFLVVLVVVDFGEFGVDNVILGSVLGGIAFGLLLVHRLAKLHRSLRQRVALGLDGFRIIALERFLQIADSVLDRAAF